MGRPVKLDSCFPIEAESPSGAAVGRAKESLLNQCGDVRFEVPFGRRGESGVALAC